MRAFTKMIAQRQAGKVQICLHPHIASWGARSDLYERDLDCIDTHSDTHCLVEWEEDGNPRNVVQKKNVKSLDGDGDNLKEGEACSVRIREGSKMVAYGAKLIGIGKCIAKCTNVTGRHLDPYHH